MNIDNPTTWRANEVLSNNLIKVHDDNEVDIKTSHRCDGLFRIDIGCLDQSRPALLGKAANGLQCCCPTSEPSDRLCHTPNKLSRKDVEAQPKSHTQSGTPYPLAQLPKDS